MNSVAEPPRTDGELLSLGLDLAIRLRDGEDRAQVRRELTSLRVSDLRELVVCLAACVDPEVPMSRLLAWCGGVVPAARPPVQLARKPLLECGSEGAYLRHRARGEDCVPCRLAMRPIWRDRAAVQAEKRRKRRGRAA